jgi:hypothetical protein
VKRKETGNSEREAEIGVAVGGDRSCSGRRQGLQWVETGGTERGDMRQEMQRGDRQSKEISIADTGNALETKV